MDQFERENLKQSIKSSLNCGQYLRRSKGGLYECPLCDSGKGKNGTGAVKFYPDTNTWFCHACQNEQLGGKAGDVLDLIMLEHGCNYTDALRIGAEMSMIPLPDDWRTAAVPRTSAAKTTAKKEHRPPEKDQADSAPDMTEYYTQCEARLADSPEALSYLAERGISRPVFEAHHIGFDPQADPAGKGHPTPRIIIPISPHHYIARRIDGVKDFAKMNNAGAIVSILDRSYLWAERIVFVTEGVFDCLSIIEAGQPAIATNSTSNIEKLLDMLHRKPSKAAFIICLDNDSDPQTAARTRMAAENLQNGLSKLGNKSIIADICGKYKDPNEALVNDRDGFRSMVASARAKMEELLNRDYLTDFMDKVQTDAYRPYPTDLEFFDDLLGGGIIPQSLLLLMASPAAGKTTLCQQLAEGMAAHGKPCVYLNLEMSREQMLAKALASRINKGSGLKYRLTATDILQGYKWTDNIREMVCAEVAKYREQIFPYLQYNPTTGNDIDSIAAHLKEIGDRAKSLGVQAPAVVLDYLHLVRSGKEKLETADLIKKVVVVLKEYAIAFDTFVIGIVAINRRSKENITMESGRDSSNIEYTGDYILALDYTEKDRDINEILQERERKMTLRVLKNRFGESGWHKDLIFKPADGLFTEWQDAGSDNPFNGTAADKVGRTVL